MSPIDYQAAKVLGVIRAKPHDYQDALELPRNQAALYDDLMSIVGIYVQGVLVINDSLYQVTAETMSAYESCCNTIRKENLAYARPIPQQIRIRFQQYLRADLPVEWLQGFLREYRLHLFGSVMWEFQTNGLLMPLRYIPLLIRKEAISDSLPILMQAMCG